jgi:hypothetical protein
MNIPLKPADEAQIPMGKFKFPLLLKIVFINAP